jgi:hypothetical protein
MTLRIVKGDLFASLLDNSDKNILIPHCCNDIGAMGSGFIIPLINYSKAPQECYFHWFGKPTEKENFDPIQPDHYRFWVSNKTPKLGEWQLVAVNKKVAIANMIGQHGVKSITNQTPIKYWAISKIMSFIRDRIVEGKLQVDEIRCPRFGSGLAGGNKEFIEALIKEIWVDAGIKVTIFEL